MSLDMILQQETKGLTDEAMMEVIRFVRFMKLEAGYHDRYLEKTRSSTGKKKYRTTGKYLGQGWMSDDFDEPLAEFGEYM